MQSVVVVLASASMVEKRFHREVRVGAQGAGQGYRIANPNDRRWQPDLIRLQHYVDQSVCYQIILKDNSPFHI